MKTKNYSIFHRNKDRKQPWVFRFRETVNNNGTLRTIHRKRILCPATVKPEEAKKTGGIGSREGGTVPPIYARKDSQPG